jgi:hypothetical protein
MYFISELIRTFDISDNQDPKLVFYFTKEKKSAAVQLVIAKIYITHQNQQLYHSICMLTSKYYWSLGWMLVIDSQYLYNNIIEENSCQLLHQKILPGETCS